MTRSPSSRTGLHGISPASAKPRRAAATPAAGARRHKAAADAAPAAGSTQRIVDAVTTAIVERRLMPGTKLVEQQLGDLFQVSRTVVRQALNQLSRDHLVVLEPARGAFVAQPSVDEARQVFEVRRMLEQQMVRQLCAVVTDEQVALLRAHLVREAAAVERIDVAGRTRLLADFHVVLARCSLIALMYQSAHDAGHSAEEHVAIVDAIARRDARAAARLMDSHLGHVERNLQLHPRAVDLAAALALA
ncbi:MAG: GntR family transcriptional regulator [Betaproteobacteria bacterium]